MKAYIISETKTGKENIDGNYYLIAETGELLAGHRCSSIAYAKGDLYSQRPERVKAFSERFGQLDVDYIGCDDMTIEELRKRNRIFYEAMERSEQNEDSRL